MMQTLAALSVPHRFQIVELLRDGPRPVNDIAEHLAISQPQASKHLRVLKGAGLVDVTPRAQQRVYELRAAPLEALHTWLERYRVLWDARFSEMDELVEELARKETIDDRDDEG